MAGRSPLRELYGRESKVTTGPRVRALAGAQAVLSPRDGKTDPAWVSLATRALLLDGYVAELSQSRGRRTPR